MVSNPILERSSEVERATAARQASPVEHEAWIPNLLSRARVKKLLFLGADVAAISAAHALAETLTRRTMNLPVTYLNPSAYFFFYVPFFAAVLYLLEGYKSHDLRRPEKELELLFKGLSFSFIALACANFVLFKSLAFSRYLLAAWYLLALLFLLVARFSLRALYGSLWRQGLARQKALLLGSAHDFADFERRLAIQRYRGYEMAGLLRMPGEGRGSDSAPFTLPVLTAIEDWEEIAEANGARLIVVHFADSAACGDPRILDIVRRCHEKRIDVEVYSNLFGGSDLRYERDEFSGCFRLSAVPRWSLLLQRAVKWMMDRVIGLAGSVATLFLIPVVAALLKWEDGGPVFYWQEYVGCDGKVHYYPKFRTMIRDADQVLWSDPELQARFVAKFKIEDDPRILRVGRFLRKYSLDEFPEFFHVLTGRLTFVGPRTISRAQRERYGPLLPKLLSVKPGLTGFWQVMGRQSTSYEERIQMDMFYIDHWSIWLDLVIIAKTFWEVLHAEGAY